MKGKGLWPKLVLVLLSVSLILGLAVAGCGPKKPEKEVIKIGFSRSLSGWGAPAAAGEQESVILWSEMVNAEGGIYVKEYGKKLPVQLIYYDDKSSPDEVVRIYERLATFDKVDVFFPPSSTEPNIAAIAVCEKYHMPMVAGTCGSSRGRELGAKYWWSVTPLEYQWMEALSDLLSAHKDEIKTVALLYCHYPFLITCYEDLKARLQKAGFDVVIEKDYPMDVKDLSEVLLNAKNKNVDAVIGHSMPSDAFMIIEQSIGVGLDPKFMYFQIGPGEYAFPQIFGAAVEGVSGMGTWCGSARFPGSKEFYEAIVKRWGHPPGLLNQTDGWHVCQLMQQAIEKAGTLDREKIREVLATEEFVTIEGPVKLQDGLNTLAVAGVMQWQKGEAQLVWPLDRATAELEFPKPPWPKR